MEKFVIEDALYLFESIKKNKMISYDDNLINIFKKFKMLQNRDPLYFN